MRCAPRPRSKPGLVDVVHPEATLQLSERRLCALRRLYMGATEPAPHAPHGAADTPTGAAHEAACGAVDAPPEETSESEQGFRRALLAMLLRYQSLDGGGFQCAVPPAVFECLRRTWGITCEGFASPLNCTLRLGGGAPEGRGAPEGGGAPGGEGANEVLSYCSAFPDVDRLFGSRGSFFDVPLNGCHPAAPSVATSAAPSITPSAAPSAELPPPSSFELNPPFSAELYAALVHRCHAALDAAEAAGHPLSFVLVVGATPPALRLPCMRQLRASVYLRGQLHVGVGRHVYVCGRQHLKAERAVFRACDTGVFLLQTTRAARQWPVTDGKLQQLRAAFEQTNSNADLERS